MLRKLFFLIIFFLITFIQINAQNMPVAAGGDISSPSGSVSYSVGEIAFNTYSTNSGIIIEGVQQAYNAADLPVTLLNFKASVVTNNQVLLEWVIISETNNAYIIVESSSDGLTFKNIGKITGKDQNTLNQSYQLVDKNPSTINYYRLVQVDNDGKSSFSNVIKISLLTKDIASVDAYPNPTTAILNLQLKSLVSNKLIYRFLTLDGKVISKEKIYNASTIINTSILSNGVYLLELKDGNNLIKTFRIIKN